MKSVVHWFRRDLRVADNTALYEAIKRGEQVYPLFIIDDSILSAPDMGAARISFLLDSLRELAGALSGLGFRLTVRKGLPENELPRFCREIQAEAVFCNRDYEPHCQQRDRRIFNLLNAGGIGFEVFKDAVMWEDGEVLTRTGTVYSVFTPFAKAWRAKTPPTPRPRIPAASHKTKPTASLDIPQTSASLGFPLRQKIPRGGESAARDLLPRFVNERLFDYEHARNFMAVEGTSQLSPHLHFGTINIRTIWESVQRARKPATPAQNKSVEVFLNELVWREFYLQILAHYPHVATGCFRPEYDQLQWQADENLFQSWCSGMTGYPIVDAAMRCLNATGWMHNRNRMIVSMFLAKDLLLPWPWGERYFMQNLVDGDQAANNGGWQWSAGTGTDAAPYFRIFNPVLQGEKFDPQGEFVRQWVPELAALPGRHIHQPWNHQLVLSAKNNYPARVVLHEEQRGKCLALFQAVRGRPPGRMPD